MHIVFVNTTGQIGGAERCLIDAVFSLRQLHPNWQLTVIAGASGPLTEACDQAGARVFVQELPQDLARLGDAATGGPAGSDASVTMLVARLLLSSFSAARFSRRLGNLLRELKPDVVHTNGLKMHFLAAWALQSHVPLIWHMHDYIGARPVMAKLLHLCSSRCTAAIANSASVAKDFQFSFTGRIPVYKVWNAVDLGAFSPHGPKLDLDKASGLPVSPNGVVRIGLVGTLGKQKGHQVFLRALAKLPEQLPVRAYVIGGPIYQTDASQWRLDDLRQQAAQLGLQKRVGFTGFVKRCADAMRSLDIVVHANTQPEPFGLVIVEAMACGRALIASRTGGAMEIFNEGVDALGHTPGDVDDLADRMVMLANDANMRKRLGEAGRRTAEHYFDRARLASQLAPIYQSVAPSHS